jgi:hypothetical protein
VSRVTFLTKVLKIFSSLEHFSWWVHIGSLPTVFDSPWLAFTAEGFRSSLFIDRVTLAFCFGVSTTGGRFGWRTSGATCATSSLMDANIFLPSFILYP